MKPERPSPSSAALTFEEAQAVEHILSLYRQGWFPMNEEWEDGKAETRWVQPNSRGIIPLDADRFHISSTLRAKVRSGKFEITSDRAFARVIHECGRPAKGREETWLDGEIVAAFLLLHKAGHAHSVEAWTIHEGQRTLIGGLYGLALGRVFCGESMFSRPALGGTDASKVCLVHLVHHLRRRGFVLLDSQLSNEHLTQFGCFDISRDEYLAVLKAQSPPGSRLEWGALEAGKTRAEA